MISRLVFPPPSTEFFLKGFTSFENLWRSRLISRQRLGQTGLVSS
jgi:hypothetical protein